jgi:hypothetical protein
LGYALRNEQELVWLKKASHRHKVRKYMNYPRILSSLGQKGRSRASMSKKPLMPLKNWGRQRKESKVEQVFK